MRYIKKILSILILVLGEEFASQATSFNAEPFSDQPIFEEVPFYFSEPTMPTTLLGDPDDEIGPPPDDDLPVPDVPTPVGDFLLPAIVFLLLYGAYKNRGAINRTST